MDDLMKAAHAGDINGLYESLRLEQNILDSINRIHFVNTPLHIAAAAGHTHFSIEIISLMPSFARKLNPDGLSPLDLALQNGHSETVKRLVKFDSELIRVQGRERLTPLHYVAKTNDINLLSEFLCACPESIKDLTIRDETALHIAVRNSCLEAFKILLEWLRRTFKRQFLNWIDEEGNTVLHIAVSTNQPQSGYEAGDKEIEISLAKIVILKLNRRRIIHKPKTVRFHWISQSNFGWVQRKYICWIH